MHNFNRSKMGKKRIGLPIQIAKGAMTQGNITNLPDGCVVEIPGYVDRTGIHMPVVGDLSL
ncbi:MAG: hypothetical protein R6V43_03230, partial [Halopseudomonas sp.]